LPDVALAPDLVFLIFLPPLLYWEALTTSWRDFRANLRPIGSLAIGLVVVTTCGVAVVAHLVLGLPWAVAFVLGAVVSSTDAVAASSIASRLGVPPRIVAILSGESLVINGLIFILIGLQLHPIFTALDKQPLPRLLGEAALVSVAVIALRLAWVYPAGALAHLLSRGSKKGAPQLSRAELSVIGWTGMRGVIALATALALPERVGHGPFPDRNLILFLTFGVIFVTLVGQGLTLPPLIRLLGVTGGDTTEREEAHARLAAAQAALTRLDTVASRDGIPQDMIEGLRARYAQRVERLSDEPGDVDEDWFRAYRDVRRDLLDVERRTIVDLRDRDEINDEALRSIQRELDLEQVRLDAGDQ